MRDASLWVLVVSNLYTLVTALYQGWDIMSLMLIYWAQSVIIGFFTIIRILSLQNFSTEGLRLRGRSVLPTKHTRSSMAFFFFIHFGGFHLGYLFFIFVSGVFPVLDSSITIGVFLGTVLVFLFNHAFSFYYHRAADREQPKNIGTIMLIPYARIIPMHITIILGGILFVETGSSRQVLVLFLLLKTLADALMHAFEHRPNP